ncbi:F-BOX WITH WD-40 2 [Striga asiatica]|uniref:F-BOX WITH WD-40 2 n=1 Tax=Striga asiatica TaxID=4170 RepID=A0A5A7RIR4_STRAF|nr:F-BOX WITH WD-40 2 [Striga asiatica]
MHTSIREKNWDESGGCAEKQQGRRRRCAWKKARRGPTGRGRGSRRDGVAAEESRRGGVAAEESRRRWMLADVLLAEDGSGDRASEKKEAIVLSERENRPSRASVARRQPQCRRLRLCFHRASATSLVGVLPLTSSALVVAPFIELTCGGTALVRGANKGRGRGGLVTPDRLIRKFRDESTSPEYMSTPPKGLCDLRLISVHVSVAVGVA